MIIKIKLKVSKSLLKLSLKIITPKPSLTQKKSATAHWKIPSSPALGSLECKLRCTQCQWWCQLWECSLLFLSCLSLVSRTATSALAWNAVTKVSKSKWEFLPQTRTLYTICSGCINRCTSNLMSHSNHTRKCTWSTSASYLINHVSPLRSNQSSPT